MSQQNSFLNSSRKAQCERDDPRRPSVVKGAFGFWLVRAYDQDGGYHCKSFSSLDEAHKLADHWAINGATTPDVR